MKRQKRTFTNEQFISAVKTSHSIAGTLKKLYLKPSGANYKMFNKLCREFALDTSHFTGQGHLKGKSHNYGTPIPLDNILIKNSSYNTNRLKKRLIRQGYIKNQCSVINCGISKWQGKPLSLHLDHINGINDDNRIENLRLLCPNCHSQTPTYCGKNKRKRIKADPKSPKPKPKPIPKCTDCNKEIDRKATRCKPCAGKFHQPTKTTWPTVSELIRMVKETSYTEVGRKLGVSDNAVRKRIKRRS